MTPSRLLPLALLLALPVLATAQVDTIRLRDGNTDTGKVELEDHLSVTFKSSKDKNARSVRYEWDKVDEIQYGGPVEYTQAMKLLAAGQTPQAIPKLQALLDNKTLRKELRPHLLFHLASAQQRSGQYAEAIAGMQALVKEQAKSPHLRTAAIAIVDMRVAMGDPTTGLADLETFVKSAREGGIDDTYVASFDLLKGRLLEALKRNGEAKTFYDVAAASRSLPPSLVAEAKLGQARCEQAAGNHENARTVYRQLVDQDHGNVVMAGAWNGLADIVREQGVKEKKADVVLDALFMYLRGVVEFGPAPGESTTEYERASAGSALCFKLLSDMETDAEKKKLYADRERDRLNQLRKEFPNSPWLKKG